VSINFHPSNYVGNFTGNGAGLNISGTTQTNLSLAGWASLLSRNASPPAQTLGANNGSLWVSNAVLYFTFTTNGTNATTVKVAGP
jgi:hypothetical protein